MKSCKWKEKVIIEDVWVWMDMRRTHKKIVWMEPGSFRWVAKCVNYHAQIFFYKIIKDNVFLRHEVQIVTT